MTFDLSQTVTLRPNRAKLGGFLAMSLVFVAIGAVMTTSGGTVRGVPAYIAGWAGVIFFGLGALVFVAMLLPGAAYLRLQPDGYTVCALFRANFYPWAAVHQFGVTRIGVRRMVGFTYEPDSEFKSRFTRINTNIAGYDNVLPDPYGLSVEALADLMNDALARARLRTR
jgi:hypothetical protein